MNILIFSVSIGNGHDQVAHTLRNEFIRTDNKTKVKIINTISFISPVLDKVILDSYMNILRFYPKAWGKIYEKTNKLDPIIDINEITNKLMTSRLRKSIKHFCPDAIICTHSFPSSILSNLIAKKLIECPLISVITDYNIHSSWINEHTDHYVIPHESLSYVIENLGVKKESILPFGIPIRPEFKLQLSKSEMQKQHGIEDERTILVMGGGLGLGAINNIVKELDRQLENIHIIAVAGRNNHLEMKLKNLITKNKLTVLGFINNVHELMEISDCVITKPGGVTTAEVISKQKPLIIFSPLPGQEIENTEFLLNSGVAVASSDVKKIPLLINQIFNFDIRLKCIKEIEEYLKKPDAAYNTVKYILEHYSESHSNELMLQNNQ